MAKQPVKRKVFIRENDFPGFLDMLRYDRCTVDNWSRVGRDNPRDFGYEVTLLSALGRTPGLEFTTERWASFGLFLKVD